MKAPSIQEVKQALKSGRPEQALRLARDVRRAIGAGNSGKAVEALYWEVVCARYLNEYESARAALDQLFELAPKHALGLQELGHLCLAQGDRKSAVSAYNRAVAADETLIASWRRLESLACERGDLNAANEAKRGIEMAEAIPPALRHAWSLYFARIYEKARARTIVFLQQHPEDVSGLRLLALIHGAQLDHDNAVKLLEVVVERAPDYRQAHLDLVMQLQKMHRYSEAIAQGAIMARQWPDDPACQTLHARGLTQIGEYEESAAIYRRLLTKGLDAPQLQVSLGHCLKTIGEIDCAVAAYRAALAVDPTCCEAYWSLANLKTFEFSSAEREAMSSLLEDETVSPGNEVYLSFALGKAQEDAGNYQEALANYRRGNEIERRRLNYSADDISARIRDQIEFFDEDYWLATHSISNVDVPQVTPVFVVGLPRVGSTLVEQIVASHSLVEGTKELPNIIAIARSLSRRVTDDAQSYPKVLASMSAEELRLLGKKYLDETAIQRPERKPYFIDKMPNNFRHIGLIKSILPQAKIIDVRRDPFVCGWSNYKQLFAEGQKFSYDFEDFADYYRDYLSVMRHWNRVFPGQILTVQYEELVTDFEVQVRALLQYLGLPFEARCLEFHKTKRSVRTASSEQVRQPLSSGGLSLPYELVAGLSDLRKALDKRGLEYAN